MADAMRVSVVFNSLGNVLGLMRQRVRDRSRSLWLPRLSSSACGVATILALQPWRLHGLAADVVSVKGETPLRAMQFKRTHVEVDRRPRQGIWDWETLPG